MDYEGFLKEPLKALRAEGYTGSSPISNGR